MNKKPEPKRATAAHALPPKVEQPHLTKEEAARQYQPPEEVHVYVEQPHLTKEEEERQGKPLPEVGPVEDQPHLTKEEEARQGKPIQLEWEVTDRNVFPVDPEHEKRDNGI